MVVILLNVPKSFHTPHLRNFFNEFIEKEAFECFHYRHRPVEKFLQYEPFIDENVAELFNFSDVNKDCRKAYAGNSFVHNDRVNESARGNNVDSIYSDKFCQFLKKSQGNCCFINVKTEFLSSFLFYNNKQWVDSEGNTSDMKCFIRPIKIETESESLTGEDEIVKCLSNAIEFGTPPYLPQGNVGTPSFYLKEMINDCKLPSSVIKKLGLEFNKRRKRRYGQVSFLYGTKVEQSLEGNNVLFTAKGHPIPSYNSQQIKQIKKCTTKSGPMFLLLPECEDGAEIEEWERHESLHNDVTEQDRTKERRYEKEIELVWEKGGPGLVFYTDAQYWKEKEGDFDEQTADDWDVDMSGYYDEGSGDLDMKEFLSMEKSNRLYAGEITESAFKKQQCLSADHKSKRHKNNKEIGNFEAHTKGIGRKVMEAQGWQDGQGLGRDNSGIAYALQNDGQHPKDKRGFGYFGEKLPLWSGCITNKSKPKNNVIISTIFDKDIDSADNYMRSEEVTCLSHRHKR